MARPRRYSIEQRKAFIGAAMKIRAAGGSWADALKAAQRLGFKGEAKYLTVLVNRFGPDRLHVTSIPETTQQRLRAQFDVLVRNGFIRNDSRRKPR